MDSKGVARAAMPIFMEGNSGAAWIDRAKHNHEISIRVTKNARAANRHFEEEKHKTSESALTSGSEAAF